MYTIIDSKTKTSTKFEDFANVFAHLLATPEAEHKHMKIRRQRKTIMAPVFFNPLHDNNTPTEEDYEAWSLRYELAQSLRFDQPAWVGTIPHETLAAITAKA